MPSKDRYDIIAEKAFAAINLIQESPVSPEDATTAPGIRYVGEQYQEYCSLESTGDLMLCTYKVSRLAERIVKELLKHQYARVMPFEREKVLRPSDGYISWLYVFPVIDSLDVDANDQIPNGDFNDREIVITHDVTPLKKAEKTDIWCSAYTRDKCIAKAVLHEVGHAVLHMKQIQKAMEEQKQLRITLPDEYEEEAWLYANMVWGGIVGFHSVWCRKKKQRDEGYVLA